MLLETLTLGELAANCHILGCGGNNCVVFDIGSNPERLLRRIEEKNLNLCAILLTHGHYDHVGGVDIVRKATGATVYIHEADAIMLKSGQANLAYQISDSPYQPVSEFQTLTDGQVLNFGSRTIKVMHTPGHTPGGICYLTDNLMFSGDTLFHGSIGRTDLGGNMTQMRSSLKRISELQGDYQVYTGHFESTTLAWERVHNSYLGAV